MGTNHSNFKVLCPRNGTAVLKGLKACTINHVPGSSLAIEVSKPSLENISFDFFFFRCQTFVLFRVVYFLCFFLSFVCFLFFHVYVVPVLPSGGGARWTGFEFERRSLYLDRRGTEQAGAQLGRVSVHERGFREGNPAHYGLGRHRLVPRGLSMCCAVVVVEVRDESFFTGAGGGGRGWQRWYW